MAEEFILQYYASAMAIPPQLVVQRGVGERRRARARRSPQRRGGPVELRHAERGDKRRILELAERNARLALDQEKLKAERRRQSRVEALDGLQRALGLDTVPLRIECFDISNLMGTDTVASMVVFEGGAPKKSDYRRFTIRGVEGADDFAAMAEVLGRRLAQFERQHDISPHDREHDASFAALPNVVVIDGGKGQLSSAVAAAAGLPRARRRRSSRWPSASRRSSSPAAARRSCSTTTRPSSSCSSACATRRTASRSPTTARAATAR